jgi:hypothetical protein
VATVEASRRNQTAPAAFCSRGVIHTVTRASKIKAPSIAAPDPRAVEAIGRALKVHHAHLVDAPLPEKFVELLARFEVADRTPEPKGSSDAVG